MDRDLNSAINILGKFLMSADLSHQLSLKKESFLDRWKGFSTTYPPRYAHQRTLSGIVGIPFL
ncbi:MAG: hypothetical protein R6U96_01550 [Promethearchaeia archaeon]